MTGHPAPPEGDGRTSYERSLAQRIGAARAALQRDKGLLWALGRDVARFQGLGRLDLARDKAAELAETRASIQNRQAWLDQLLAERDGDGA